MVEFLIGESGSGKTTLMFERIKNTSGECCVIVPEQYSYEFDKTLYFYIGADRFNELISTTFTGLSRYIFQLFGEPGRNGEYADEFAQLIMMHQALGKVRSMPEALTYFKTRSRQKEFSDDVLALINNLKRAGIEPEKLYTSGIYNDKRLEDKLSDISLIYLEYERLMNEYGFKTTLENVREATAAVAFNGWFKGKSVFFDEFDSFSADQLVMIREAVSMADNVTFVLRTDKADTSKFTLFETVNNTYRKIMAICRDLGAETRITECRESYRFRSPELKYLSKNILRNKKADLSNAPQPENIRLFEARDMYSEAEYVCATIKRLMHGDDTLKYRNIAILSNNIMDYSEVLVSAFRRYDIPYFMSVEKPVDHAAVMVFFLSLLELLNSREIRSEQIFRILKSGILDVSLKEVSLFENYCYKWSVDKDDWYKPFTAPDKELEVIEALHNDCIMPMIRLKKKLSKPMRASEAVKLLYRYIIGCGAEKNLGRLMDRLINDDLEFEAAELKRLWGCLIDILDSISSTLGDIEISFSELSDIMKTVIGRLTYSVPPQTLDNVIAASAQSVRLNAPRIVFIMGANDGDFPSLITSHGLFSEGDKMKLAQNSIEIERPLTELIAAERLSVYKALSTASHKLFITYTLSDLSGQAKYPSPVIDSIKKMFGANNILITENDTPPHYYAVTLSSAFYHYMQNKEKDKKGSASLMKVLSAHSEYSRRISYVLSRSAHKQNYRIDPEIITSLKSFSPLVISPSHLDDYNKCHFMYFCNKMLRLFSCEKMELDARISGELIHSCFCDILGSRSKESFLSLSYEDIRNEITQCADKYITKNLGGDFAKDSRFDFKLNKITERLSTVFLHTQQSLMVSDFTPHSYELDLSRQNFISMKLSDKYSIKFGGVVDRVDICNINGKNYIRVVDYKSKTKEIDPETLSSGINLQMLLYLFSITDAGGIYEGYEPAGVLYSPHSINRVEEEEHRIGTVNSSAINSSLKTSGLVLNDTDVLNAMEKGIRGEYIPVKLKVNGEPRKDSDCITREGLAQLRNFTYAKLKEMGESLLSGDVEALPLLSEGKLPCEYCDYMNICGNSFSNNVRCPDAVSLAEAEDILAKKF